MTDPSSQRARIAAQSKRVKKAMYFAIALGLFYGVIVLNIPTGYHWPVCIIGAGAFLIYAFLNREMFRKNGP